jgi:transposase
MKLHANAPFGPKGRRIMVLRVLEQGWSLTEAAAAAGVSDRSAAKWLARWRAEGAAGLLDRSSAPKRVPHRTPARRVEAIVALRRLRMTAAEIAEVLSMALSTVSAVLRRVGLGKRSREGVRGTVCEAGATGFMCQSGSRSPKWILSPLRAFVQL